MSQLQRITFNPNPGGGRPSIRVKNMLEMLTAGETERTTLTDFSDLQPEDTRACLE